MPAIEPLGEAGAHETATGEAEVDPFAGDEQFVDTAPNAAAVATITNDSRGDLLFTLGKLP